jgi:hypothetical protein
MGARGRWTRRLAAGGTGVAINAGLLALLILTPDAPPMVDPPVVQVALEPREVPSSRRPPAPARRAGASASTVSPRLPARDLEPAASPVTPAGSDLSQSVEPRWRVGGGEYLDPETARRARRAWEAAEDRRYKRACLGQSSEHMTEEEKFACWDAWGGNAPANATGARPGGRYPGLSTTPSPLPAGRLRPDRPLLDRQAPPASTTEKPR